MMEPAQIRAVDRVAETFGPTPPKKTNTIRTTKHAWSRRLKPVLLASLGVALLAAGYHFMLRPSAVPVAAVAPAKPPAVVGLGYLEPVSTVIKIGAPGSADALRIGLLKVTEGDEVEAGQVLAVLDTADKHAAQVAASQAQLTLKRLILEKQRIEIASVITARRSALERARAELDLNQADFNRQETLLNRGVTTVAFLEKKRRELLSSQATVREMEASLARIETLAETTTGAPGSLIDVAVTEQEVAAAEADLKVTRANLEMATIRAPFKGRILTIHTHAGERIGSDGVLEMGATQSMRAVVEVYQSDIGRIRLGQTVSVHAVIFDKPLAGSVERVGSSVKRQSVVNNDPATATDARVVEVFVVFDETSSRTIAALSRLQVQAVFAP